MLIERKQDSLINSGAVYIREDDAGTGSPVIHVVPPGGGTKVRVVIDAGTKPKYLDQLGRWLAGWSQEMNGGKAYIRGHEEGSASDLTDVWFSWTEDGGGVPKVIVTATHPSQSVTAVVEYTGDDATAFKKWCWWTAQQFLAVPDWSH